MLSVMSPMNNEYSGLYQETIRITCLYDQLRFHNTFSQQEQQTDRIISSTTQESIERRKQAKVFVKLQMCLYL